MSVYVDLVVLLLSIYAVSVEQEIDDDRLVPSVYPTVLVGIGVTRLQWSSTYVIRMSSVRSKFLGSLCLVIHSRLPWCLVKMV